MTNELINNNTNELSVANSDASSLLDQSSEVESGELKKLGATDWIPLMSVAQFMSDSVKQGIAVGGEFVLSGKTSLGKEITVTTLAYRLHVALINIDTNDFVENQYCMMGQNTSEAYRTLATLNPPPRHTVVEGADMFMYLPDHSTFAQIFLKGQLAQDVDNIWRMSKGGRCAKIKTNMQQNKSKSRAWFRISVTQMQDSLNIAKTGAQNIPIDVDLYKKYLGQFSNPATAAAETVTESGAEETIER